MQMRVSVVWARQRLLAWAPRHRSWRFPAAGFYADMQHDALITRSREALDPYVGDRGGGTRDARGIKNLLFSPRPGAPTQTEAEPLPEGSAYTLLYSTLLYSTLLYSTLPYSTLLYSTLLYYRCPT